jgi:hypothetical protein
MSNTQRFEDLLPLWRKETGERITAAAARMAQEAVANLPEVIKDDDPARLAAIRERVTTDVANFTSEDLVPGAVSWLAAQGFGPPEDTAARIQVEAVVALRQKLPPFQPALPPPTSRTAPLAWAVVAGIGTLLGWLVIAQLSLLVIGQREPGLLLGAPTGAAVAVGLLASLVQQPRLLDALRRVAGAPNLRDALKGVGKVFRKQALGGLRTVTLVFGGWLLLLIIRPRLRPPTRTASREALEGQIERLLAHAADLALAVCWSHPDRLGAPVPSSAPTATLPGAVADALGVLQEAEAAGERHLRGAVHALLQRVREEGYEWRDVPSGTPYSADLDGFFECFGLVRPGQPVETLEPALVRRGAVVKAGRLRSL